MIGNQTKHNVCMRACTCAKTINFGTTIRKHWHIQQWLHHFAKTRKLDDCYKTNKVYQFQRQTILKHTYDNQTWLMRFKHLWSPVYPKATCLPHDRSDVVHNQFLYAAQDSSHGSIYKPLSQTNPAAKFCNTALGYRRVHEPRIRTNIIFVNIQLPHTTLYLINHSTNKFFAIFPTVIHHSIQHLNFKPTLGVELTYRIGINFQNL